MRSKKKQQNIDKKDELFQESMIPKHTPNEDRNVEEQIETSMMGYGEYIIEERGIASALDGLKNVQRRALVSYKDVSAIGKNVKLARIVGETIGKYHPHGDKSISDAVGNMVQVWKNTLPLCSGQGNWGSIAGDNPAAMRYVETMLTKEMAGLLFENLHKTDVVPWKDNYDDTIKEPALLPVKFPFHVINGSRGIAYSYASNIPAFNIQEITNLFIYLIDNNFYKKDFSIEDNKKKISKIVKGPDFPTGCEIYTLDNEDISSSLFDTSFKVKMRCKYELDEKNHRIYFTNIPYELKTDTIKEEIFKLSKEEIEKKDNKTKKITKIRKDPKDVLALDEAPDVNINEEDNNDVLITISIKKDANLETELFKILNGTSLTTSIGFNMTMITDAGIPKQMSLVENMILFLRFRFHVIANSLFYDRAKLEHAIEMLNALLIILRKKEIFMKILTISDNVKEDLLNEFTELNEEQITYVLDSKINRLSKKEIEKLEKDIALKKDDISDLDTILSSEDNVYDYIKEEYIDLLNNNSLIKSSKRRCNIVKNVQELSIEDTIPDEKITLMLMNDESFGYVDSKKLQSRDKQSISKNSAVNKSTFDLNVKLQFDCSTKDELLFFTNKGRVFGEKAWKFANKFIPIRTYINLSKDEHILKITKKEVDKDLIITTKHLIKHIKLDSYSKVTNNSSKAFIKVDDNDKITSIHIQDEEKYISIITEEGKAMTFEVSEIGILGSGGSKGRLAIPKQQNIFKSFLTENLDEELLMITDSGRGRSINIQDDIEMKKISQSPNKLFELSVSKHGNVLDYLLLNKKTYSFISESNDIIHLTKEELTSKIRVVKGSCQILDFNIISIK
jgi:DNA gyrase subunit A